MWQLIKAIKTELVLKGEVAIDTDNKHSAACLEDTLNSFLIDC
jgi:hypothetical protein